MAEAGSTSVFSGIYPGVKLRAQNACVLDRRPFLFRKSHGFFVPGFFPPERRGFRLFFEMSRRAAANVQSRKKDLSFINVPDTVYCP
jgi:hypothetical protein